MPTTFYTTCPANLARAYMPRTPVLVTATSYWRLSGARRQLAGEIRPASNLPLDLPEVAADSGGFMAAVRNSGRYPFSLEAYARWLETIPNLSWAALPDLPCEPQLARDAATIRARQQYTIDAARALWGEETEHVPASWTWVPTIQGHSVQDYVWHAEQLLPFIAEQTREYDYTAYGEDRYATAPYGTRDAEDPWLSEDQLDEAERGAAARRVGIGSLCNRTKAGEVVEIVRELRAVLGPVLGRFHLWGVKLGAIPALREAGLLDCVASLDSAMWNERRGRDIEMLRQEQTDMALTQSEHAWAISWQRYTAKVAAALEPAPPQLRSAA